MRCRMDQNILDEAIDLYLNDYKETIASICASCGVSKATLYRELRKRGINRSKKRGPARAPVKDDARNRAVQMYLESDLSIRQIAMQCGMSESTLYRELRERGDIAARGQGKRVDLLRKEE